MRDFFVGLFKDDTFGPNIELYNIWHILVLVIIIAVTVTLAVTFRNKSNKSKKTLLDVYAIAIICLYFLDFFIHPLMNDENSLIVDKLPFHLCTSAGLLVGFTRLFPNKTKSWYHAPAILGIIGAFLYIIVPTGIAGNRLFCYRTIQTLIYHGMLLTYGILAICFQDVKLNIKKIYVEAIIIAIQIVIALIANAVYSIPEGRSDAHSYNWYFIKGGFLGLPISDLAMPFIVFFVFTAMAVIIYGIYYLVIKIKAKKQH